MQDLLSVLPFLTKEKCRSVYDSLQHLRSIWIERNTFNPGNTYTVGIATYLDATSPAAYAESYAPAVQGNNKILYENFADIYESLRERVAMVLDAPVVFSEELALPGFHVFRGGGMDHFGQIKPHFDCQYQRLPRFSNLKSPRAISLTLPIRLPEVGGGLDYWDMTLDRFEDGYRNASLTSVEQYMQDAICQTLSYTAGNLVIHRDLFLHRIAATIDRPEQHDERITLQGHGLKDETGTWVLYW